MADITSIMGGFNADEYEEQPEFDNSPLPAGDYYVEIEKAEIKPTKKGDGTLCEVTFSVLGDVHDNGHKGRKTWARFNLSNPSAKCQQIGQAQFHGLRLAVNRPMANDTDELLSQNLVITVGLEKGGDGKTEPKKYMALEGYEKPDKAAAAAAPAKPQPTAAAPAAAAVKKQPWD